MIDLRDCKSVEVLKELIGILSLCGEILEWVSDGVQSLTDRLSKCSATEKTKEPELEKHY